LWAVAIFDNNNDGSERKSGPSAVFTAERRPAGGVALEGLNRVRQAAEAGAEPGGGLQIDRELRHHCGTDARPTAQGGVQADRVEWFHVRLSEIEAGC
jgi:hypothetical protein